MESNIGIIVLARLNSQRLKEKVIQKINGKTTLEILLDHIINDKYQVILAIPQSKENDILEQIAIEKGVDVYRGDDDCPTCRLLAVADQNNFEHIVRITCDDILIDQTLLRNQIKFHINGNNDYTYMARCPEGIAGEIIKVSALEKIIKKVDKSIEFPHYYFKKEGLKIKEFFPPFEYQYTFRVTMDYEADLMVLRILFLSLHEGFGTLDMINFLIMHKYLCQINHLPKITIYTCNYNTQDYITNCIDSVLAQTYEDYEFIILDDFSLDNSVNKILEYYSLLPIQKQKKIKILRNTKNEGLSACCNKILIEAKGKYIIRIDSDDLLKPDALEKMIEEIEKNNVQGVITSYYETDKDLNIINEVHKNNWHPAGSLLAKWCINELKYREDLQYFEGLDFFNRFIKFYKINFLDIPLWFYRKREGQKTSQNNLEERRKIKKELNISITNGSQTSL